jgi:methylmalonyl-CoA mutase C-terminal domain/subunit
MEVIYTGLHQTVEQIVKTAVQEAVDVVGLSIMSGAHIPICQKLLEMMKNEGLQDIPVVVGGVIPKQDIPRLSEQGIAGVFPGGTPFDKIVAGINKVIT